MDIQEMMSLSYKQSAIYRLSKRITCFNCKSPHAIFEVELTSGDKSINSVTYSPATNRIHYG